MSSLSDRIRLLAEEPDIRMPEPAPPTRRIITPSHLLLLSPSQSQSVVCSVRTTEAGLDAVIAEVRRVAKGAGYVRTAWFIGPSSRPTNIEALLLERGFVPSHPPVFEPEFTAMALTSPPPAPPPGVEARLVRTFDEFLQGFAIAMKAFDEPPEVAAEWLAAAPKLWPGHDGINQIPHMAYVDGRPVGYSYSAAAEDGLLLGGCGVLADARGRGAYRALIAARWALAVELGKPALVVHAGPMSRPILERCGFERVCTLRLFEDPEMTRQ
jgi:hypothetical protein